MAPVEPELQQVAAQRAADTEIVCPAGIVDHHDPKGHRIRLPDRAVDLPAAGEALKMEVPQVGDRVAVSVVPAEVALEAVLVAALVAVPVVAAEVETEAEAPEVQEAADPVDPVVVQVAARAAVRVVPAVALVAVEVAEEVAAQDPDRRDLVQEADPMVPPQVRTVEDQAVAPAVEKVEMLLAGATVEMAPLLLRLMREPR